MYTEYIRRQELLMGAGLAGIFYSFPYLFYVSTFLLAFKCRCYQTIMAPEKYSKYIRKFKSLDCICNPSIQMNCTIWQKYCFLSRVSNLSNFKTVRDATKTNSIKSIYRANIHRIHLVLLCCISHRSQDTNV